MEDRIRLARLRSGVSVADLAQRMAIHKDYYHCLERKADRITPCHLVSFCQVTSADPSWIIYGDNPPPTIPLSAPTIGQRIREFRTLNHITAGAFAQQAFGVSKASSLSKWETDRMTPELRTLMRISAAYSFSVMSFIPHTSP